MATLGVWLIVLTGLNILTGYSGQISLGHAAFVASGAYITAILLDQTAAPVVVAILAGAIGTMALGFAIGIPALRLTGPYLAIATLAIVVSLPQFLKWDKVSEWTKGATGIDLPSTDVPTFLGLNRFMDDSQWLYYSVMVPAIIMTALAWNLMRSRIGRAFVAVRDSEIGAQQMGVNVSLYKTLAFAISALYAGVGGGLFVYTFDFVAPDSFGVFQSIEFLVVIVIGGLASTLGSVLAAIFFVYQDGVVERLAEVIGFPARLRWAFFGAGLILIMIVAPNGVAGLVKTFRLDSVSEVLRQTSPSAIIRALRNHPIVERLGVSSWFGEDPDEPGEGK
jgi:branched-chain amino acid transport system permease protein